MTERLEAGRVLGEKYELKSLLGEGGMGSVWVANHLVLGSEVAVKVINPTAKDERLTKRFLNEAKAAAALRSPHVVQILDYGVDDELPFIVMERLVGESLSQRLDREMRLSPELTEKIITHVARALTRAHDAGLVHRDLKPDNVFLVINEDEILCKVLDFGIVKALGDDAAFAGAQTDTGSVVGSPYYMSPEQAYGKGQVDHRADLWSLGVIAYECLLGNIPFEGDGVGEVMVKICRDPVPVPSHVGPVPVGFDAWFAQAMQRDPDERFQSARELAQALREVLNPEAAARAAMVSSYDSDGKVSRPDSGDDYVRSDALAPTMAESDSGAPLTQRSTTPLTSERDRRDVTTVRPESERARRRRRLMAVAGALVVAVAAVTAFRMGSSPAEPEPAPAAATPAVEDEPEPSPEPAPAAEARRESETEAPAEPQPSASAEPPAASAQEAAKPQPAPVPRPAPRPHRVAPAAKPAAKKAAPSLDSLLEERR